nr:HNH endonuclease [Pseudomonas sp. SZ57]
MKGVRVSRAAIPAEVRRAVLVESGHRCAIPRCNETELDVHHIVPWETCRTHDYANLIALCPLCHRRTHKGEIDRKSLMIYKANLAKEFGRQDTGTFQAPVVESRRRMIEENSGQPGFTFQFDFPDFPSTVERIVSRNIEAWGYELLAGLQDSQEQAEIDYPNEDNPFGTLKSELFGSYRVVRRDERVISIEYTVDFYPSGAAHGGRETKVVNYLIKPFNPITLEYLLGNMERLPELSEFLRQKLARTGGYDLGWLATGTAAIAENFSLFNIESYGITFTFSEYQIACFAAGEQKVWVGFDEIRHICDSKVIALIEKNAT